MRNFATGVTSFIELARRSLKNVVLSIFSGY